MLRFPAQDAAGSLPLRLPRHGAPSAPFISPPLSPPPWGLILIYKMAAAQPARTLVKRLRVPLGKGVYGVDRILPSACSLGLTDIRRGSSP